MADVERKNGYYWVCPDEMTGWVIAEIVNGKAFTVSSVWGIDVAQIDEIDERRITRD